MSDVPRETGAPAAGDERGEIPEEVDVAEADGDEQSPEPDEGQEADLGDDEGEGEAGTARPVEPPRRQTPQQRYAEDNRKLRNELAAQRADFERQLAQLVQQQRQPSAAEIAAQERAEAEAVSMMAPAEVAKYYSDKAERRSEQRLLSMQQMLWDQNDATAFENHVRTEPVYSKQTSAQRQRMLDKVEEYRRQAPGVSRMILCDAAVGAISREDARRAMTRASNRSVESEQRHRVRPPSNGRGDVAAPSGRGGATNWERLRNVQI